MNRKQHTLTIVLALIAGLIGGMVSSWLFMGQPVFAETERKTTKGVIVTCGGPHLGLAEDFALVGLVKKELVLDWQHLSICEPGKCLDKKECILIDISTDMSCKGFVFVSYVLIINEIIDGKAKAVGYKHSNMFGPKEDIYKMAQSIANSARMRLGLELRQIEGRANNFYY